MGQNASQGRCTAARELLRRKGSRGSVAAARKTRRRGRPSPKMEVRGAADRRCGSFAAGGESRVCESERDKGERLKDREEGWWALVGFFKKASFIEK